MHIELLRSDVASLKVDAIVNPRPAQPKDGKNPYANRSEVLSGGNLLCKFIIQAILPPPGTDDAERHIHAATLSAIRRADELALRSIAFPPCNILTGETGESCARAMVGAALDFAPHARSVQHVVFCAFSAPAYELLERALKELQH